MFLLFQTIYRKFNAKYKINNNGFPQIDSMGLKQMVGEKKQRRLTIMLIHKDVFTSNFIIV